MGVMIDGGAAGIQFDLARLQGDKLFFFSGQAVVQFHLFCSPRFVFYPHKRYRFYGALFDWIDFRRFFSPLRAFLHWAIGAEELRRYRLDFLAPTAPSATISQLRFR